MKFSVLIVGLGRIGCGYDASAPGDRVFTHTRAFTRHGGFAIAAGVDRDGVARDRFVQLSGVNAVARVDELRGHRFDVVVVATPANAHLETVREVLPLTQRLLILEKPVASTLADAAAIRRLVMDTELPCWVNYIRRADPGMRELQLRLRNGAYGRLTGGHCVYSGGVVNTASHYVDLLNFLLGPGALVATAPASSTAADPAVAFTARYDGRDILFYPVIGSAFELGEIDLFFDSGRVRLSDCCERIEVWKSAESEFLGGPARLVSDGSAIETDMGRYQLNVVDELFAYLTGVRTELSSTLDSGLEALEICVGQPHATAAALQ